MRKDYPPDWGNRRKEVYLNDNYRCQNCGAKGGRDGNAILHAHHIVPKSQGGSHDISNLTTLCESCHQRAHGIDDLRSSDTSTIYDHITEPWYFSRRYTPFLSKLFHVLTLITGALLVVVSLTYLVTAAVTSVANAATVIEETVVSIRALLFLGLSQPAVLGIVIGGAYILHLYDRDQRGEVRRRVSKIGDRSRKQFAVTLTTLTAALIGLFVMEYVSLGQRYLLAGMLIYTGIGVYYCYKLTVCLHIDKGDGVNRRPWVWDSTTRLGLVFTIFAWGGLVPQLALSYYWFGVIPILAGIAYLGSYFRREHSVSEAKQVAWETVSKARRR